MSRKQLSVSLSTLLRTVQPGHRKEPWTWEDEERDIRGRLCLCCGKPGHYQESVEARIAEHGLTEGVCIGEDGRLHDGHHRVVAAKALGIERVPLETKDEADSRWLRDHGSFIWELRQFGDVHAGECWSYVQNFRQSARDFAARERKESRDPVAANTATRECLAYLKAKAWADYGGNVVVNDAPLEVWIDRVLRGESPKRAGREYHPRSKVDNG